MLTSVRVKNEFNRFEYGFRGTQRAFLLPTVIAIILTIVSSPASSLAAPWQRPPSPVTVTIEGTLEVGRGENAHCPSRTIGIYTDSWGSETERTAELLARYLQHPPILNVKFFNRETSPQVRGAVPDFYLQLQYLPHNSPKPMHRWLLTMSDRWERLADESGEFGSLPVAKLMYRGEITVTPNDGKMATLRSEAALSEIAIQIRNHLMGVWDGTLKLESHEISMRWMESRFPRLPHPELLPDLYPTFQPPPRLAFLKTHEASLKFCGSSLCRPTLAVWEFKAPDDVSTWYEADRASIAAEGWEPPDQPGEQMVAEFGREGERFQIFRKAALAGVHEDQKRPQTSTFILIYERVWQETDYAAAIDKALASNSIAEMNLLVPWWKLRKATVEHWLKSHPPTTADGWLEIAKFAAEEGRREDRKRALQMAVIFCHCLEDHERAKHIETKAMEEGFTNLSKMPERETVESVGIPIIKLNEELQIPLTPASPIMVFISDPRPAYGDFIKIDVLPYSDQDSVLISSHVDWQRESTFSDLRITTVPLEFERDPKSEKTLIGGTTFSGTSTHATVVSSHRDHSFEIRILRKQIDSCCINTEKRGATGGLSASANGLRRLQPHF